MCGARAYMGNLLFFLLFSLCPLCQEDDHSFEYRVAEQKVTSQFYLINVYRILHSTKAKYILPKVWGTFTWIDHILATKTITNIKEWKGCKICSQTVRE